MYTNLFRGFYWTVNKYAVVFYPSYEEMAKREREYWPALW